MRVRSLRRAGFVACAVATVALMGATTASAAPGDGSAYGVKAGVSLLGAPAINLGPVAAASTEGPTESTAVSAALNGVISTGVITAKAVRDDETGVVSSSASTAGVRLPLLSVLGEFGADAVTATCEATQAGVTGKSELLGLKLGRVGGGSANPAPNTVISIKLGIIEIAELTLNEQIPNPDGSLTVNAIHLKLLGGVVGSLGTGDVYVSSATCGPAAPPVPLASGAGLWIGLAAVGAVAVPVGIRFTRGRRGATQAG
ncbi:hypothetical protein CFN78_02145 [Amycolatopsis antarctica]|uniref:Sortase n=1 Tax=Amycolatopsis antarctica TaxID=1854586 RepID=A0A263D9F8_9PSEU|nr:choice-of-anchor P family protein [Amycolatopsis antarctica]OZM75011.1 hypothetical protein CFN78_02145 [Amycolatopsis antarctica]